MSHRKCKKCRTIINNRIYQMEDCPNCGSIEMCNPLEHNNDWQELYDLQIENMILKQKLNRE